MLNKTMFYLLVVAGMITTMTGLFFMAFPVNQYDPAIGATMLLVALGKYWIAHKLETK